MRDFSNHIQDIRACVTAARRAADPAHLVADHLAVDGDGVRVAEQRYTPQRIFLVASGKAAIAMATSAAQRLGEQLTTGIVISKPAEAPQLPSPLRYRQGSHPVPSQASVAATDAVRQLLHEATGQDLLLCLISGGTSALLTQPTLPLARWQALNQALLHAGCTINEINTIRQQFDDVKGGGLACWAAPAPCATLILSDVIGNNLAHIGSGPTAPTPDNSAGAMAILDRYALWDRLDAETAQAVRDALAQPVGRAGVDSAESASAPNTVHNTLIGDVGVAAAAVRDHAAQLGFDATILSQTLTGEARDIGAMAAARAVDTPPGRALIWGGESTVTVRGDGIGGRNQEIALAAAVSLDQREESGASRCVIASFATDAEDGPTPVAGAYVTADTVRDAAAIGLEAREMLDNNNSYPFFRACEQHANVSGGQLSAETGTNVNDILLILTYAPHI